MNRLLSILVVIVLLGNLFSYSQEGLVDRQKKIFAGQNDHQLDSLSIVPGSFFILGPGGQPLDSAFYYLDAMNARLSLRLPEYLQRDSLEVGYRVFPVLLGAPYYHKDVAEVFAAADSAFPFFFGPRHEISEQGLLQVSGLKSSGSITRGIMVGNRQDLSLQSAMNLQLSGNISEEIEVSAVISDQNIPFQPDGTTRQIQEFDKVYIELSGMGGQITAGDFTLERPKGHFMSFNRRAQGSMGSYSTKGHGGGLMSGAEVDLLVAGAIARGKYVKNQLQAVEGNQGPYKLSGAGNESFIIVLAGTERVFIDGELLVRGMEHDYVIDYNMAELSFTSRRIITRESRIVVEFEYAERNYVRSMMFGGMRLSNENAAVSINFFSEQDHRNKPLFQEITPERRGKMAEAGDSLHLAFDWNVEVTSFFNDRVMYLMTDTLGYDSVFVHSTDPQNAVYRPGFSFMGHGHGNYIQINSTANGRVFQWVSPVNGERQGTHEPIIQLVTPKKTQMLSVATDYKLGPYSKAGLEFALSNHDLNLFSKKDKSDNIGYGLLARFDHKQPLVALGDGHWSMSISGTHELASIHFNPIERYRSVEFDRDWNLEEKRGPATENNTSLGIELMHSEKGAVRYQFQSFHQKEQYAGITNKANLDLKLGVYRLFYSGSLLKSSGLQNTGFYRHHSGLSRRIWFFKAGIDHRMEDNRHRLAKNDSLLLSSNAFDQWRFYVSQPDSARNQYGVYYQLRKDRKPLGTGFSEDTRSREAGIHYELRGKSDQRVLLNLNLRSLAFSGQVGEQSFGGRLDYFSRWFNGVVTSSLFYESGSGMERKREYIYLMVPPGQGVFTWVDYNGNGIMELDEFELAPFPDQAEFIRIFIPTEDFFRVFSIRYSHTLNLDPRIAWRDETGLKGLLARFNNQTSLRIDKKEQGEFLLKQFSPFLLDVADTALLNLNSQLRNSLSFNRSGKVFFMEWVFQDSRNKMLLSNGFESRISKNHALRIRYLINRSISAELLTGLDKKENHAAFFLNRNYLIESFYLDPILSYQQGNRWRIRLFFGFSERKNTRMEPGEKAVIGKSGLEIRYSIPGKGNLTAKYQWSKIDYPYDLNTPVAFEMLEGLAAGNNHILNLNWQQNLNAWLQLNVNYHARKTQASQIIHSGTMQIRALF